MIVLLPPRSHAASKIRVLRYNEATPGRAALGRMDGGEQRLKFWPIKR